LSAVRHVFVLTLENKNFDHTFGPSTPAPYLGQTLPSQGQLLTQYFGIGHQSLDNYVAMVSGQAPNPVTQADCQTFADFVPPAPVLDPSGQAVGQGCVFPAGVPTLMDQLDHAGLSWRGYMDDMKTPCRHPALNAHDDTQSAKVGDQYAARHNPFVYFHGVIDDDAACKSHVVDLTQLPTDLASAASTPNFSFISPSLCNDGHDAPCVDGRPGGLVSIDAFLQQWVPKILGSPAFKQDGMLVITFDEAEFGATASAAACCGEAPGPNSALPGINGPGGGRVGAVVLSPFTTPGTTNTTPYNHYALLRTVEDVFGLDHIGFAAASGLRSFGDDVLGAGAAAPSTSATATTASASASSSPARSLAATGRTLPSVLVIAAAAVLAFLLVFRLVRTRRSV
jgi:hypothetical protein